jgi:hypothetical protein
LLTRPPLLDDAFAETRDLGLHRAPVIAANLDLRTGGTRGVSTPRLSA